MPLTTLSIPETLTYGNYLVAFIDILGHEDAILKTPDVYLTGMEKDKTFDNTFIQPARGLARLAEGLTETEDSFYSPASHPRLRKLQEGNPSLKAPAIHAIPFSDGIVWRE